MGCTCAQGPHVGRVYLLAPPVWGGRAICQSLRGRVPALNSIVQVPRPVPAAGDREAGRERGEVPRARTHTAPAFWYVPSRSVDVVVFPPPPPPLSPPSLLMHRVAVAAGAVQGAKCTLGGMTASVDVRPQAGGMALRGVEVAWIVRMVAGQGQGQA